MLMLFRFIISIGNANFWADTNPMSTAKAFPFHFKLLIGSAVVLRDRQFVVRYGAAVLEELVQYRARLSRLMYLSPVEN